MACVGQYLLDLRHLREINPENVLMKPETASHLPTQPDKRVPAPGGSRPPAPCLSIAWLVATPVLDGRLDRQKHNAAPLIVALNILHATAQNSKIELIVFANRTDRNNLFYLISKKTYCFKLTM